MTLTVLSLPPQLVFPGSFNFASKPEPNLSLIIGPSPLSYTPIIQSNFVLVDRTASDKTPVFSPPRKKSL
jgi:hypothetical protein